MAILVVDDELIQRKVLCRTLTTVGFDDVIGLDSAEAAFEHLSTKEATAVEAVLIDARMPGGMGGVEACRRLRSDPRTATLPVLILSAGGDLDLARAAAEAGASGYLEKPVDVETLARRLREILGEAVGPR